MTDQTQKADFVISRADRVMAQLDSRSGIVRDARKRELRRLNQGLTSTFVKVGIAVGIISVVTILIGLVQPIGMFGFLAAVIATDAVIEPAGIIPIPMPRPSLQ